MRSKTKNGLARKEQFDRAKLVSRNPKGGEIVYGSELVELSGSVAQRSARFEQIKFRQKVAELALRFEVENVSDADISDGLHDIVRDADSSKG